MKQLHLLSLVVVMLLAALNAGSGICVNLPSGALMLNADYEAVIPPGRYSRISPLGGSGFLALQYESDGKYRVANARGRVLGDASYDEIYVSGENIVACRGGKYALFSLTLMPLTGYDYSAIFPSGEHFFAFRSNIWDDGGDILYILDGMGEETPTNRTLYYTDLLYSEGLVAAMSFQTGRYGYLDEEGVWALEPVYQYAGAFNGGLAAAGVDGKMGLIDARGSWIVSPVFDTLLLGRRYVIASEGGTLFVYARSADGLMPVYQKSGVHGADMDRYFAVYTDSYVYLYTAAGNLSTAFSKDTLLYPALGSSVIACDSNGMFLYDVLSHTMSDFYDHIQPFTAADMYRCAIRERGGRYLFGALSSDGKELIEPKYKSVTAPNENTLAAETEDELLVFYVSGGKADLKYSSPLGAEESD